MRLTLLAILCAFSTTFTAPTTPHVRWAEWQLQVPLDSGMVLVEARRGAYVQIIAPTGTFHISVDSPDSLVRWARQAVDAGESARRGGGGDAFASLTSRLSGPNEFLLEPLLGDTSGAFLLTGTNGGWEFSLHLSAAQSAALFGAFGGEASAGAVPFRDPALTTAGPPEEYRPHVTGAWLDSQVERTVQPRSPVVIAGYPRELIGTGVSGSVNFTFIVDSNGRARPSSVRLIGPVHRLFATAAHEALMASRYFPARRAGKPVPQLVMQRFELREH